jgi:hypothetical protein
VWRLVAASAAKAEVGRQNEITSQVVLLMTENAMCFFLNSEAVVSSRLVSLRCLTNLTAYPNKGITRNTTALEAHFTVRFYPIVLE